MNLCVYLIFPHRKQCMLLNQVAGIQDRRILKNKRTTRGTHEKSTCLLVMHCLSTSYERLFFAFWIEIIKDILYTFLHLWR